MSVNKVAKYTIDTIVALREQDIRFQDERDRRYSEVKAEQEKALKIKEEADKTALGLAREIQVYKDEKANELRTQIERERGNYATKEDINTLSEKFDTAHRPVVEFIASQVGRSGSATDSRVIIFAVLSLIIAFMGVIAAVGTALIIAFG
jgi:hypothetical protein